MQLRQTSLSLLACLCAVSLCVAPCTALPVPPPPAARLHSEEVSTTGHRMPRTTSEDFCPRGWHYKECFRVYLKVYARAYADAMKEIEEDPLRTRGIGKRVSNPNAPSLCPNWIAEKKCRTLNLVISRFFGEDLS